MDAKLQDAWDDVSGAALDPTEVRRARLKEIQYIKDRTGLEEDKKLHAEGTRS